jgi:hypothetical protein
MPSSNSPTLPTTPSYFPLLPCDNQGTYANLMCFSLTVMSFTSRMIIVEYDYNCLAYISVTFRLNGEE